MKYTCRGYIILLLLVIIGVSSISVYAYTPTDLSNSLAREFSIDDAALRESITSANKENRDQIKYVYIVSTEDSIFCDCWYVICSVNKINVEKDFNTLLNGLKEIAKSRGIEVPRGYLGEPSYFDNFEFTITPYDPYQTAA